MLATQGTMNSYTIYWNDKWVLGSKWKAIYLCSNAFHDGGYDGWCIFLSNSLHFS